MKPPEWVDAIIEKVRENAASEEISPVAFIMCAQTVFIIPSSTISIKDHNQAKEVFSALVRRAAIEKNADAVLLVSEAWTHTATSLAEVDTSVPVSQHPDRTEAIVMILETQDGSWMSLSPIVGKMGSRTFGPVDFTDSHVEGRMTNFIPDKRVTLEKPQ